MFYDAFAALIEQSGDALEARDAEPSEDPRFLREGRQIATFLRRTGSVWPELFATLEAETAALEQGRDALDTRLRGAGHAPLPSSEISDPLERYRAVNRTLDAAVEQLAPWSDEPWTREALGELRRHLARAAKIQGELVERMLEVR